jgi:hypothetical protein
LKIFKLSADSNNYQNLVPVDIASWDIINSINLKSVANNWNPIELQYINKRKKGDCPSLIPHLPVFSEKAINILSDLIKDSVEYLPFVCPGKIKFWGINVLKAVDCIDFDNSQVVRFDSGRIMRFAKYAFKKELLEGVPLFKIPDLLNSCVFIDEMFIDKVTEAGLEGFKFEEVG